MPKTATKTTEPAETRVGIKSQVELVPLDRIKVSELEPQLRRREHFKPEETQELADSILSNGLISPITVRPWNGLGTHAGGDFDGTYELVAGERRYLATKLAGFDSIEAVVRDLDDQQTIEIQLHENLKRLEIEPLDEAFSYKYLLDHAEILEGTVKRPYTVADIAAKFSRTEEIILRRLKLTDLIEKGRKDLSEGFLPLAHAELLARFPETLQVSLLKKSVYRYGSDDRTQGATTYSDLRRTIENNNITLSLAGAKFDREDPSLRSDGLVCSACPNRTGFSPKLFNDTNLGKKDCCLDSKCWDGKLRAMLQAKREKIAAEIPNPKDLPIKQIALEVPLVKKDSSESYYAHRNISIGKGIYLENSWSKKTHSVCKGKNACKFTEKALRVGGDGIGAATFICRSKACSTHKVKEEANRGGYDYEADRLKRAEHELNVKIANAVRIPLIAKKVTQFSEANWIFDNDEGRRFLLASILTRDYRSIISSIEAFSDIVPAELTKNQYQDKNFYNIVTKFDASVVSQLLALICFSLFGKSDYSTLGDQTPVKQLAAEFGDNYELQSAMERVTYTPEGDHRIAAQNHLDAIRAGKKSKPPTVYWPRQKKKGDKKSAKGKAEAKVVADEAGELEGGE